MSKFNTIDSLDVKGKTVFVRADLNVPLDDNLNVTSTTRIDRTAPTIQALLKKGAKVLVSSHLGRPKGEKNAKYSLKPVIEPMKKALGGSVNVTLAPDCIGEEVEEMVKNLKEGSVLVLENLRFYAEEEKNDADFAKKLAKLADIYVNDAFSSAHRAHASTEGMAKLLPNAAGLLMQEELEALDAALGTPKRPVAALVGGAKVSTKLDLLGNLVSKVDVLVIGGGMANTFLYAKGVNVGASLCEKEMADTAKEIIKKAEVAKCEIVLPTDVVVASEFADNAPNKVVGVNDVPSDMMILDVGPESAKVLAEKLSSCKTLVWNGPLGAFEKKPFDAATNLVAKAAAKLTKEGKLLTVAGGGDTVSALNCAGVKSDFSYISTAGGAFLEWMEGKELPGVVALYH
ncbi:MAG: phosphoglycerate kinase [Alphaproteobacteria bacterium]